MIKDGFLKSPVSSFNMTSWRLFATHISPIFGRKIKQIFETNEIQSIDLKSVHVQRHYLAKTFVYANFYASSGKMSVDRST